MFENLCTSTPVIADSVVFNDQDALEAAILRAAKGFKKELRPLVKKYMPEALKSYDSKPEGEIPWFLIDVTEDSDLYHAAFESDLHQKWCSEVSKAFVKEFKAGIEDYELKSVFKRMSSALSTLDYFSDYYDPYEDGIEEFRRLFKK